MALTKRRLKRKIIKNKNTIIGILIVLFLIIISILFLSLYSNIPEQEPIPKIERKYLEITENDIFSLEKFSYKDISVKGVMLGDRPDEVVKKIGYPNHQSVYQPNIVNMEYSTNLGMNKTGLILHFENKFLTRITIKEPFNIYLKGKTKINYTKDEMYMMFGKPDDIKFVPISPNNVLVYRLYVYLDKGLEFIIRKNKQNGFTFFIP